MSRLQQGMGELQLLSKPSEEDMSVTNKMSNSATSVSTTSSEHLEASAATSGKHLEHLEPLAATSGKNLED